MYIHTYVQPFSQILIETGLGKDAVQGYPIGNVLTQSHVFATFKYGGILV